MPWSKNKMTTVTVMEYKPKDFTLVTPEVALNYLDEKKSGSDFIMSDILRQTTGIAEIEKQSEEKKIEDLALEKVALIQQEAYARGFEFGQAEGFKKAFDEKTSEINSYLDQFEKLINKMNEIKLELAHQNENHLVTLAYQIAQKIAFDHIQENPEIILSVIQKSIETAQADEDITVSVATSQLDFIEKMKLKNLREYEFLKNIKLVAVDHIDPGGCIVETNYGVIDARIPERINKLWDELKQSLPKVKLKVG